MLYIIIKVWIYHLTTNGPTLNVWPYSATNKCCNCSSLSAPNDILVCLGVLIHRSFVMNTTAYIIAQIVIRDFKL